jgi:hypothetical protein
VCIHPPPVAYSREYRPSRPGDDPRFGQKRSGGPFRIESLLIDDEKQRFQYRTPRGMSGTITTAERKDSWAVLGRRLSPRDSLAQLTCSWTRGYDIRAASTFHCREKFRPGSTDLLSSLKEPRLQE